MKSPISLPASFSIGASAIRPVRGIRFASSPSSQASAPGPVTANLAKLAISVTPTPSRTARTSVPTALKSFERWKDSRSSAGSPAGAYQSGTSMPQVTPITARFSPTWMS